MYGKNGIKGVKLFRQLPKAFVRKIRGLTFDQIKKVLGEYLDDKEIQAVIARKKILLQEIDDMIEEQGEDKVLY